MSAKDEATRKKRKRLTWLISLAGFMLIGALRHYFIQPEISLEATKTQVSEIHSTHVINAYLLALLSWGFFLFAYHLLMYLWIPKKQKDDHAVYKARKKEYNKLKAQYDDVTTQIDALATDTVTEINDTVAVQEYENGSINKAKSIGLNGQSLYLQAYINYSNLPLAEYMNINYLYNKNDNNHEDTN